ncbi:MAG: signal peptidase II [Suilimivivens sp.]
MILLTMIAAGAIGNMIDRLRFDYVVDFIYIVLINFSDFQCGRYVCNIRHSDTDHSGFVCI